MKSWMAKKLQIHENSVDSPIAILNRIKKIPPTNNIIPVEISMLVGRSALDEYNDPTDQLIAAITNEIIPTNSNFIFEVSISTNCAAIEGNINITKPTVPVITPRYSELLQLFSIYYFPK